MAETTPTSPRPSRLQRMKDFINAEPEDTPLPDVLAKSATDLDGILYHLNELRKHLFRALIVMAVTTALSFIYTDKLLYYLSRPIGGLDKLQAIDVTEPIGLYMRVALLSGFALALPYIAFELWLFMAPGLSKRSRLFGLAAIPFVVVFFLAGAAFAYFVMLPTAIPFLLGFVPGIHTVPRPASYVGFVTTLMFWVGIAFEFPLVVYILATFGFVNSRMLLKQWRVAIVIIAVIAAAITPTVDPINMSLVMGPMIILYFLSIFLASLAQRGRPKAEA